MLLLDIAARLVIIAVGAIIVMGTFTSAIRSFVLARSARDPITAFVFLNMRKLFNLRVRKAQTYEARDRIMELYAPISLITLPLVWLFFVMIGYALIYFASGVTPFDHALTISGSSLLTLGFATAEGTGYRLLEFSEAAIGLILTAILMSYLPTMYNAFSQRESLVSMLEVRAGTPPSSAEMFIRVYRIRGLTTLDEMWDDWERWFTFVEESHTSLAPLVFFRSPRPQHSWVTAAGVVLDTAALRASTLDLPREPRAELCIRAGYLALRSIADFFRIAHDPDPRPTDPISISRQEFDEVYDQLRAEGIPVKADRAQCWRDYAGWRVNYDTVLLRLAALTMAPYAPWVSDRSLPAVPNSNRLGFGIVRGKNGGGQPSVRT
jgi:hypothetical protein